MRLEDYIIRYYDDNKAEFARDNNIVNRQQVHEMIQKGTYYAYDGMLLLLRKELADPEFEYFDDFDEDDMTTLTTTQVSVLLNIPESRLSVFLNNNPDFPESYNRDLVMAWVQDNRPELVISPCVTSQQRRTFSE